MLPDGTVAAERMADTACLASPAIRQFNKAFAKDLLLEYPNITGFRIDWPEYPCYTWGELFADFSPHVEAWAEAHGFDFASIRADVSALETFLTTGLTDEVRACPCCLLLLLLLPLLVVVVVPMVPTCSASLTLSAEHAPAQLAAAAGGAAAAAGAPFR